MNTKKLNMTTKKQVVKALQTFHGFGKELAEELLEKYIDIFEVNCSDCSAKEIAIDINEQYEQDHG